MCVPVHVCIVFGYSIPVKTKVLVLNMHNACFPYVFNYFLLFAPNAPVDIGAFDTSNIHCIS